MGRNLSYSGVDWIGNIPLDWEVKKLGMHFENRKVKVNDTEFPPLSVTKKGIVPQLESAAKSNANDNRKQVLINDFVINSRSDRKGSCGLSKLDGSVSLICTVLKLRNIDSDYSKYLLDNHGFAEEFYRWGHGIVADLWTTRFVEMKKILIPYPKYEEQKAISKYLDDKTNKIDELIKVQEDAIHKLNEYSASFIENVLTKGLNNKADLKKSNLFGVEAYPLHWNTIQLSKLADRSTRYSFTGGPFGSDLKTSDYVEEGIRIIQLQNIGVRKFINNNKIYTSVDKADQLYSCNIFPGDIILAKMADPVARACIVPNIVDRFVMSSDGIRLVPLKSKYCSKYLVYAFNSQYFKYLASMHSTGSTRLRIGLTTLKRLKILVPPFNEQMDIVDYLDNKLMYINKLIETKKEKIEKLNEYKKSLIYEAVTGKIEVM